MAVISLKGILDSAAEAQLNKIIAESLSEDCSHFIFDLSGLRTSSSPCVGFFIKALAQVRRQYGQVVLVQPSGLITTAFEAVLLDEHIPHASDLESALRMIIEP